MSNIDNIQSEDQSSQASCSHALSTADLSSLTAHINLPVTALEAIGAKAKELLDTEGAITPAPGQSPDARMVLSRTGKRPHLVTPKRNGGFSCDSECPQYQSSGVCSHVVGTAEVSGKLIIIVCELS